jgi:hypothetical protein
MLGSRFVPAKRKSGDASRQRNLPTARTQAGSESHNENGRPGRPAAPDAYVRGTHVLVVIAIFALAERDPADPWRWSC